MFLALCEHQALWHLISLLFLLPNLGIFFTSICWSVFSWLLKVNPLYSLQCSFWREISPLWNSPVNSCYPGSLYSQPHLFNSWIFPGCFSLHHSLETCSKQKEAWVDCRNCDYFVISQEITDTHCLVSQICCVMYCFHFLYCFMWGDPVPVMLFWPESETSNGF